MSQKLWIKDWEKINEILLKLNSEQDILKALDTFLLDVEKLIPYEKACIKNSGKIIIRFKSRFYLQGFLQ